MKFSRTAAVAALFVWSATTAQEERSLSLKTIYGTEDEFELTSVVKARDKAKPDAATKLYVGHFRANANPGFALTACGLIEEQFVSDTVCTCSISKVKSSDVRFGCQHRDILCNQWNVCGRPVYTGTVSLDSPVYKSNFCLKSYHVLGEKQAFGDLCVSVNQGREVGLPGNCRAQLGTTKCKCSLCNGGDGILLDCSQINNSFVSTVCNEIGLVTGINGKNASVVDFLPSFRKK